MSGLPLEYPVLSPPEVGGAVPLYPGVLWLRLPVPGSLRHINVWLLDEGPGWTLVDTGMDVPEARTAWEGPLAAVLAGRPLLRIVCTHHHPDHAGLAAWLAARHGAPVWMSAKEERLLRVLLDSTGDPAAQQARIAAFEAEGLVATEALRPMMAVAGYGKVMSGIPADIRPLGEGDVLTIGAIRWVVRIARGHTDGQVLLHAPAEGLLIAGDQVLPRITSNIGIYPEREDLDPLGSFLASLESLALLDPEPLVLPSHGDVFRGLRRRVAVLQEHHAVTLERLSAAAVAGSASAVDFAAVLFRAGLDPLNRILAHGETLAHLYYLVVRGRLAVTSGPGQVRRYGARVIPEPTRPGAILADL